MGYEHVIKINNSNNYDYLKFLLKKNGIVFRMNKDNIVLDVKNVITLDKFIEGKKFLDINNLDKFIYDLGYQLLMLKKDNKSMMNINLTDIYIINNEHYLYIPLDEMLELYNNHINIPPSINPNRIEDQRFLSPELNKIMEMKGNAYYSNLYYTNIYYNLSNIILHCFNITLKSIYYSKPYFFLKRCMDPDPVKRTFIFV